jgi:hypothetical protein
MARAKAYEKPAWVKTTAACGWFFYVNYSISKY